MHFVIANYLPQINRWFGAILALIPLLLICPLGEGIGRVSVLTFLGLSLLLASIRGDSGCEVMSIPGIIFKNHTHLVCIVFSPIDWLEEVISKRI